MVMKQDDIDEKLGITGCARCGHRLEGEIECPFCSLFPDKPRKEACPVGIHNRLLSHLPLSLNAVIPRLNFFEKVLACSGCLFWFGMYQLFF
jgi:hypothetical protein